MMAALVLAGPRWVPWVFAVRMATVISVTPGGWEQGRAGELGRAAIIVGAYALAAVVLRHVGFAKAHVREFGWFAGVAVAVAPFVAGFGIAVIDANAHDVSVGTALKDTRVFWVGDALAIATVTPVVLLCAYAFRFGRQRTHLPLSVVGRAEAVIQVGLVCLIPLTVMWTNEHQTPLWLVFAFLPLMWVAMRQDLMATAWGVLVTTTLAVVALRVSLSIGDLLQMQFVLLAGTLAALYAASVRRTNEDLVAELIERGSRLSHLLADARLEISEFDALGRPRPVPPDGGSSDDSITTLLADRPHLVGPVAAAQRPATFEWDAVDAAGQPRSFMSTAAALHRADGAFDGVFVITTDRTDVEAAHQALRRQLRTDELTALANRQGFIEELERRHGPDTSLGIGVVNLDDDVLTGGVDHATADQIIADVAGRLVASVGNDADVARTGPHAFAFAVPAPAGESALTEAIARRMLGALDDNVVIGSNVYALTATAGVAVDGALASEVLRRAELAARARQPTGADRLIRHGRAIEQEAQSRRSVAAELRQAIERHEFDAWYQPIIRLSDGAIIGAEALARWRHPQRGMVQPLDFIGAAERTSMIRSVDLAVLELGVQQISEWDRQEILPADFYLSVNLSPMHLDDPRLIDDLSRIATRIKPDHVRFEITETTAMSDPQHVRQVLDACREMGFAFILDDFGTGYSSMAWLHRLPVTGLKIDQTFVAGLPDNQDCRRIAELVTNLAADLGLAVTAEGVETQEQADCVRDFGCASGQGFLFGRPAPTLELVRN